MMALPPEPIIQDALNTLNSFLEGLYYMYQVLSDEGRKHLDNYCTGMIFGLEGSKMLVKIANTLINPVDANGEVIELGTSRGERQKRMGGQEFDIAANAKNFVNEVGAAFAKHYGPKSDDL